MDRLRLLSNLLRSYPFTPRAKRPVKNAEGEEDETNYSSTARSNDYAKETSVMLDQVRAMATPTVDAINPYQPLDVEGMAQCNPYTSYNFGPSAGPKNNEPAFAMVDVAKEAIKQKDDYQPHKVSTSQMGIAEGSIVDSRLDPNYEVPSEALSEYAAAEGIYMEPDVAIDVVDEPGNVKDVNTNTNSTATSGAPPPKGGRKKKALQPMANKRQAPPSTSPKPQHPKQQTALGTNTAARVTSPLQQSAHQISEAPPSISPKPQYPKQQTAADISAAAKVTSSPVQQSVQQVSEDTKPLPKPARQSVEAPAVALRRSVSAAKPAQGEKPAQQVTQQSSMADRKCTRLGHGGNSKGDGTVQPKVQSAAGPVPPHVALKSTSAKPEGKARVTAKMSQGTTSAVEAYPVRSEGIQQTPPTPAVQHSLLPPTTSAGQLKPTGNLQSGSTDGTLSVVERARLLEKIM